MHKKVLLPIVYGAILLLLAGYVGVNAATDVLNPEGDIAGFWWGLWKGFMCWFVILFNAVYSESISIYEVHNNGVRHDFGFMLGIGILFYAGGMASLKK